MLKGSTGKWYYEGLVWEIRRCTENCRSEEEIDEFLNTWDISFEYNNQHYQTNVYGPENTADTLEYVLYPIDQERKRVALITPHHV